MKRILTALILLSGSLSSVEAQEWYWTEVKELFPPERNQDDFFGESVAISGDYAIVGSPGYDVKLSEVHEIPEAGVVYFYERDSSGQWKQVHKVNGGEFMGSSVAISGNYAIVGARGDKWDVGNNYIGAAYIFERDAGGEWKMVQLIPAEFGGKQFGQSVAIRGDLAVVADPESNRNVGQINIYKRDHAGEWKIFQRFAVEYGQFRGPEVGELQFGSSLSIGEDHILVGSIREYGNTGAVYVLKRVESGQWAGYWNIVQKLYASDASGQEYFGTSISLSGNYAIVGTQGGKAYMFQLQGNGQWKEVQKITPSKPNQRTYFGASVSLSGDYAVIGDEAASSDSVVGAAYIFRREDNGKWVEMQRVVPDWSDKGSYVADVGSLRSTVATDGDRIIVGGRNADFDANGNDSLRNAGAAHIYALWSTASVVEQSFDHPVSFYPNPFGKELNVELGRRYRQISLTVRNVAGEVISTKDIAEADLLRVDVEGPAGIYFVEITTPEGMATTLKLVKRE